MGVMFNVLLFTVTNLVSYSIAEAEYLSTRPVGIVPDYGFRWGFPLEWGRDYSMIIEASTILNIFLGAVSSFFFGFLFKFIWSKISRRRVELK